MNFTLKLEELGMLLFGIFLFQFLDYDWWIFAALFFVPDVGMLGYLFGSKTGAVAYNLFHHKGLAILLYIAGLNVMSEELQLTGLILFCHASFDRLLGYGLKYEQGFKFTHLGEIGRPSKAVE